MLAIRDVATTAVRIDGIFLARPGRTLSPLSLAASLPNGAPAEKYQ
jgi:hypothetical protein